MYDIRTKIQLSMDVITTDCVTVISLICRRMICIMSLLLIELQDIVKPIVECCMSHGYWQRWSECGSCLITISI